MDPLYEAVPRVAGLLALPAGPALMAPVLWRAAQILAAPELNGRTAPGAWAGVPWFVPGPVAGVPYYA